LLDGGVITRASRRSYDLDRVREEYILNQREVAAGRIKTGELDPAQERARKDRALAEGTEVRNDLTRGSVVLIEDVTRLVVGEHGIVRSRVLSMPSRIASRVPEPVRAMVMAAAQQEAHAALEALSATRKETAHG